MDSRYDHQLHEASIYQAWEAENAFSPDGGKMAAAAGRKPSGKSFSIIMPPPNANDPLHVGHAMFISLEDVLIRFHRMLGDDTLWLPGTDHAGIETQFVFEKKLSKQDKTRFDYDRETLYQMIWDYVQENSGIAVTQMKRLGASADWSRFKFMLEPDVVNDALKTFIELHKKDLIYRDLRLVNYCTHCGTAFSELEVVYKEQNSPLYYVRYRHADSPKNYEVIATTRPEPIFVDTHIAVHPDNPKTKHLIGKQLLNPLTDEPMTVIADEFVDQEFGTGIVKLTPAHDFTDFDVAKKHNLPLIEAIDTRGKIIPNSHPIAAKYAGKSVKKARELVVEDLRAKNLIEKIDEKYTNRVGTCYRCGRAIEPLLLPQFFVKVEPLTKAVMESLDAGEVKVHGAGHDKILRHWLENLRDWNISRQIVWGIRMPVWYDTSKNPELSAVFINDDGEKVMGTIANLISENQYSLEQIKKGLQTLTVPRETEYVISQESPGPNFIQETDTFDTWFSSGQWPYTTLMNARVGDFERFYPTSVMETGYDILPFWVMRMLMLGLFRTGKVPFKDVYLHGLVRDAKGQKMSKSKGNVINPLDVSDKFGADSLRIALVIRSTAGLDKSVAETDFKAMRNLTNKIWNAARFIILQSQSNAFSSDKRASDQSFYQKLNQTITAITQQLTDFKIGLAAETAYNEFWHGFCDESIEAAKRGELSNLAVLDGLKTYLKLLHPFVPFVTEAVWQELKTANLITDSEPWLITSAWPQEYGS